MREKIDSARCHIHGSQPCEVFVENLEAHKERYNKKRRRISKQMAEKELEEYYEEKELDS